MLSDSDTCHAEDLQAPRCPPRHQLTSSTLRVHAGCIQQRQFFQFHNKKLVPKLQLSYLIVSVTRHARCSAGSTGRRRLPPQTPVPSFSDRTFDVSLSTEVGFNCLRKGKCCVASRAAPHSATLPTLERRDNPSWRLAIQLGHLFHSILT
jgi:hypothetical protein